VHLLPKSVQVMDMDMFVKLEEPDDDSAEEFVTESVEYEHPSISMDQHEFSPLDDDVIDDEPAGYADNDDTGSQMEHAEMDGESFVYVVSHG
jgi:hypothetical protein